MKEKERGWDQKQTHGHRKFTKMKPGLTWLIARGSDAVAGDTGWVERPIVVVLEECRDIGMEKFASWDCCRDDSVAALLCWSSRIEVRSIVSRSGEVAC